MADSEDDKPIKKDDEKGDLGGLNSPELDENTGKPKNKAVSSFEQAHSISKQLYDDAKDSRLVTAAQVERKYGAEAPWIQKELEKTGQDWRNNFSTNFLGSVVDRSKPQLTDPIKKTESITYSSLGEDHPEGAEKTRKFRARTTKLVRSWSGWNNFLDQVSQQDYLHGGALPGWIDDDWRPKAFKTDEAFLPKGSGQHASLLQFILYRQPMLLHDFIKKLEDKEVAIDANYDWKGCIEAANEAGNLSDGRGSDSPLEASDSIRENQSPNYKFSGEVKVIWMHHLLVREYNGGVDMWTTSEKGKPIRHVENLHESMEDATTPFTLQTGNEKFYGSKGAGRLLANLHIAIERGRNLGQDQMHLAGLTILQCDEKDMNSFQPVVRHPFILIRKSTLPVKEEIKYDWQAFQFADKNLVAIAESIAGAFIPPKIDQGGSPSTKIEAAQKAERELAVRDGVLGRFFLQFADLVSAMQRKIYKPENIKEAIRIYEEAMRKRKEGKFMMGARLYSWLQEVFGGKSKNAEPIEESVIADRDAVEAIVDLLQDGLTPEEIVELAISPAGNNIADQGEEQDAQTVNFIQTKVQEGNPFFNQKAMAKKQATIMVGREVAEEILNSDQEDPNDEAIGTRMQIMEFSEMVDGNSMPVAGTDNHSIHINVLTEHLSPLMQAMEVNPTPELLTCGNLAVQHMELHVGMHKFPSPDHQAAAMQAIEGWKGILKNAEQMLAKQAEEAQAAQAEAAAQQPGANGAPAPSVEETQLLADTLLRSRDIAVKEKKVGLEERKLDMADEDSTVKMATDAMQNVADQAAQAQQEGMQAAERDLQAQRQAEAAKTSSS